MWSFRWIEVIKVVWYELSASYATQMSHLAPKISQLQELLGEITDFKSVVNDKSQHDLEIV